MATPADDRREGCAEPGLAGGDIVAGDLELVAELLRVGPDHPLWVRTRRELGLRARPELALLARRGEIHDAARRKLGWRKVVRTPNVALDPENALLLADRMVIKALRPDGPFYRGLGDWDPTEGPLTDWSLGCCLLQFPNSWRSLWGSVPTDAARRSDVLSLGDVLSLDSPQAAGLEGDARGRVYEDPAINVVTRLAGRDRINKLRTKDADVVQLGVLKSAGYSETEALAFMGAGPGLKSKGWRRKKQWRQNGREEEV